MEYPANELPAPSPAVVSHPAASDGESEKANKSSSSSSSVSSDTESSYTGELIGSDAWESAEQYGADSVLTAEARKFFNAVNWEALALIATGCRDGIQCSYADPDKFSVGQFNMVRRLDFADGVRWVARVRLPKEATPVPLELYDSRKGFEIEVASMKFFKSKSTIPVPELFAYNYDSSNEVGAPYILMEYIHGTTAHELAFMKDSDPCCYGTEEEDCRFRKQMARVQAQVLAFQFPMIGSLYYNEEKEDFYIGPDSDTGKGPWATSADYYHDLTDQALRESAGQDYINPKKQTSFCAPVLLKYILDKHQQHGEGPFRLTNRDFGAHNLLVDIDFNIVGVIDFDGIFAAPPEVAAQYPALTGLDPEAPGVVITNPYALKRIAICRPKISEYKEWMKEYEAEFCGNAVISNLLESPGAVAYQGMWASGVQCNFSHDTWFTAALSLLKEYGRKGDAV
ncbi:hypothetical protein F4808DRAFT_126531 [Astrocystis sublimbata]|nr:hypothetical protein F4808DRAFT_126531 [Astrocystis sublimbata]